MTKQTFTFTETDNLVIIEGNIPSNKVLSIRSAFARATGLPLTENKTVFFKKSGDTGAFNTIDLFNNTQKLSDTGSFNYILVPGEGITAHCPDLIEEQRVYLEVEYEILNAVIL